MDESLHLRFAYELVDEQGGLSQRVLRELVGGPRRHAELEHLQYGRQENALNEALRRLEGQGLIGRRTSQREVAIKHTFELTPLGARAQAVMQQMRPVESTPPAVPRRQRSELARDRARMPGWTLRAR